MFQENTRLVRHNTHRELREKMTLKMMMKTETNESTKTPSTTTNTQEYDIFQTQNGSERLGNHDREWERKWLSKPTWQKVKSMIHHDIQYNSSCTWIQRKEWTWMKERRPSVLAQHHHHDYLSVNVTWKSKTLALELKTSFPVVSTDCPDWLSKTLKNKIWIRLGCFSLTLVCQKRIQFLLLFLFSLR